MKNSFCNLAILLILFVSLTACFGWAQEDSTADNEASAATTATEEPIADEAAADADSDANDSEPAETKSPSGGLAAQAFQEVFSAWKKRLEELRDIKLKYQIAEESELAGLEESWEKLLQETSGMADDLQAKAMAAFTESPNGDRELTRFLLTAATDKIKQERYADAYEMTETLMDGGSEERGLNDLAGVSAFGCNKFEPAEKYLKEAEARGTLSQQGTKFVSLLDSAQENWENELAIRAEEAKADDLPRVKLQTENGDVVLELFENEAPETVGNFISLVERGFYDGLKFHRVLEGFMAQTGCPNGDGTGGPGYNIYCECVNEDHRKHFAGSLSMAKEPSRNTGGSQFFITFVPTPHLDGQHTVFGRVIEGMDVVQGIQKVDPSDTKSAKEPSKIVKAEVLRKRDHEYRPNKVK